MTGPRIKKKGEFLLICAVFALLAGIGVAYMALDVRSRMDNLRKNGVVSAAEITGMESREYRNMKVTGGGRRVSRHTTDYTLNLSFDKHAATGHIDFQAGKPLASQGDPLPYPGSIDVSRDVYEAHKEGDTIMVTFRSDIASYDKDGFQLTQTVEEQSSFGFLIWWYLAAAASLLFGMWGIFRYRALNSNDR